jgi:psp operon transcriptional activator
VRELKNVIERAIYRATDLDEPIDEIVFDPFASPWRPVGSLAPAAPTQTPPPPDRHLSRRRQ